MKPSTFLRSLRAGVTPSQVEEIKQFSADVEQCLADAVGSRIALVENVSRLTLQSGGKRLRPILVYLAASATGRPFDRERTVRLGACLEMIHMATLVHDDVIDHADTRRGSPTAFSVYGNTASVLGGDVLLAKAMVMLADDGDLDIIRTVSRAVVDLAEGEVHELELRGKLDLSEAEHFEVLSQKTATFIAACCRTGARIAGATESEEDALAEFGHDVGTAFQIVDDLLDYRGDSSKTGKPVATDFREGCATLPLIRLHATLTDDERLFVAERFDNGVDENDLATVVRWMEERKTFCSAQQTADSLLANAVERLDVLPESPYRQLLASVADFVGARES